MYPHGSGRSSIPGQTVFSLLLSLVGLLFFIIFFVIYRREKTKERDERSLTSGTIVFHSFHTTRFSGCIRLSSVTCSEGLKTIQSLAFTACPALKDITCPPVSHPFQTAPFRMTVRPRSMSQKTQKVKSTACAKDSGTSITERKKDR